MAKHSRALVVRNALCRYAPKVETPPEVLLSMCKHGPLAAHYRELYGGDAGAGIAK